MKNNNNNYIMKNNHHTPNPRYTQTQQIGSQAPNNGTIGNRPASSTNGNKSQALFVTGGLLALCMICITFLSGSK